MYTCLDVVCDLDRSEMFGYNVRISKKYQAEKMALSLQATVVTVVRAPVLRMAEHYHWKDLKIALSAKISSTNVHKKFRNNLEIAKCNIVHIYMLITYFTCQEYFCFLLCLYLRPPSWPLLFKAVHQCQLNDCVTWRSKFRWGHRKYFEIRLSILLQMTSAKWFGHKNVLQIYVNLLSLICIATNTYFSR